LSQIRFLYTVIPRNYGIRAGDGGAGNNIFNVPGGWCVGGRLVISLEIEVRDRGLTSI